jgi:glycosyltransferase involved in cell wall biosynthesis
VVANHGIGDLDSLLIQERVGVFVQRFAREAYVEAAGRLRDMMRDPYLGARCRQVAERRFSLEAGATAYADLYREIAHQSASAASAH